MTKYKSLKHTRWESNYTTWYLSKIKKENALRNSTNGTGEVLRKMAFQKECEIGVGHMKSDHMPMMISLPSKHSVIQVVE